MTTTSPRASRHETGGTGPALGTNRQISPAPAAFPHRAAGPTAIVGAATMVAGAIVWATAGADLWGLVDGDVPVDTYLADVAASASTLHIAHTLWMVGVFVLTMGGVLLAGRRADAAANAARATYVIGTALALPAFMAMVALTRLAEADTDEPALANALAFFGARLDDVATVAILGVGPTLLVAASPRWMPSWLIVLACVSGAAGLLSIVSIFFGMAGTLGFLIVPVGMIWTVAAGIVAIGTTRGDPEVSAAGETA